MIMRGLHTRTRVGATVLVLILAFLLVGTSAASAAPSAENTIESIENFADREADWIQIQTNAYTDFLAVGDPSVDEALTELNRVKAFIANEPPWAEARIRELMARYPENADVQETGEDSIADVYDSAASELAAVEAEYDEFVGTTTTTTTTTTVPPVTTTTTTTIPSAVAATTTTTIPSVVVPTTPPSVAALATTIGITPQGSSSSALIVADSSSISHTPTVNITPLLNLVRVSLPAPVADPLIDLLLILQIVAAAFVSGILTLTWPAGILLLIVSVEALRKRHMANPTVGPA